MIHFLDCEFNSMKGRLISLALVAEDGQREFYEVLETPFAIDPWVQANVMPVLHKAPVTLEVFQERLKRYLKQFPRNHIMADYPIDIKYLCDVLETGPGDWMEIQPITFEIDDDLSAKASKILHNALEDARALRESWLKKEGAEA